MRTFIIALLASLALSPQAYAANASFKCSEHSSKVEKLICHDSELAQLDSSLASLYHLVMKSIPADEQAALKSEQREWIHSRNACDKAADPKMCIKEEYHARIGELKDR